jgi:threonine aldolase
MINLMNDYNSPAHPHILEHILKASENKYIGYGLDEESKDARATIRLLLNDNNAAIHFLIGGTQTNLVSLSAFLRPHEAVIAPASAHINTHETGAIEYSGHKILSFETPDGKATPQNVQSIFDLHIDEHMVKPRLLFVSQSTEYGTVYTKAEMIALKEVCLRNDMLLYVDGARLGYALTSDSCDLSIQDIHRIADAFYIGGTKNGLLFGEALVIRNPKLGQDFRYQMKQCGGLLAKGYLLGIQFQALLENGLYFTLAKHANSMAHKLAEGLRFQGYSFEVQTESNQVFPIIDNANLARLEQKILFNRWNRIASDQTSIRLITTWETKESDIDAVLKLMR